MEISAGAVKVMTCSPVVKEIVVPAAMEIFPSSKVMEPLLTLKSPLSVVVTVIVPSSLTPNRKLLSSVAETVMPASAAN